jgi:predicted  nucleic acid-binding Zn-ribbon protein
MQHHLYCSHKLNRLRDLAHALADAKHREDLDEAMAKRQTSSELHSIQIFTLLKQNTELTILIKDMTERIDSLTQELAKAQGVCNT